MCVFRSINYSSRKTTIDMEYRQMQNAHTFYEMIDINTEHTFILCEYSIIII